MLILFHNITVFTTYIDLQFTVLVFDVQSFSYKNWNIWTVVYSLKFE